MGCEELRCLVWSRAGVTVVTAVTMVHALVTALLSLLWRWCSSLRQWATTAQNDTAGLRLRSTQGGKERVVTVVTSVHAPVTALLRYYVTRLPAVADNIRKYLSKYLTTAFYCCIFVPWEVSPLPRQYNNKYSAKALIINTMLYIYLT